MPDVDAQLLAKARGKTPADPAVRACWDSVILAIIAGWLAADDVRRLVGELRGGRDVGIHRLLFEHVGEELRVSFDGYATLCSPGAMCDELARITAEEPVDAASLMATVIVWEHSGDGELPYQARIDGRNLMIRVNDFPAEPLYTLIVDGEDLANLEDWPPAWERPPVPRPLLDMLAEGPDRRQSDMAIGIGRLRVWSKQLCGFTAGGPADIAAALGIAGSVVTRTSGSATVEPPPPGTTSLSLLCHQGRVESLMVTFSGAILTRADFDVYFGHGMRLPRIHWDSAHQLSYHVEVPGAPSTCTVFPSFADEPVDTTAASGVVLRRDQP